MITKNDVWIGSIVVFSLVLEYFALIHNLNIAIFVISIILYSIASFLIIEIMIKDGKNEEEKEN